MKLFIEALIKYILGIISVGLLIFIPAGSIEYSYGWLFIISLFSPMLITGIVLIIKNPKLLKKRLNVKEKEDTQKHLIIISGFMFIIGFIIAGLNYRFSWTNLPNIIIVLSTVLFIIFYILYIEILRENTYLFRTIEVKENQTVIETGFYSIIRHPMYLTTIVMFLTIPLILNSIISFIIFLIYPVIIVKRIENEEEILKKELKGYKKYQKKVKYKLIPFIW